MTSRGRWRGRLLGSLDRLRRSLHDLIGRKDSAESPPPQDDEPGVPEEPEPGAEGRDHTEDKDLAGREPAEESPAPEVARHDPLPAVDADEEAPRAEEAPDRTAAGTYTPIGSVRHARTSRPASPPDSDAEPSDSGEAPDTWAPTLVFGTAGEPPTAWGRAVPPAVRGLGASADRLNVASLPRPRVRVRTRLVPAESSDTGVEDEPAQELSDDLFNYVARVINRKLRAPQSPAEED